LHLIIP